MPLYYPTFTAPILHAMNPAGFQQINDFFDQYAGAIERLDSKAMSQFYSMPCLFVTNDSSTGFSEYSKLEGLFNQGFTFYKQFGIVKARPAVWSKHFWTEKLANVRVNWAYFDELQHLIYDCDYQYVMRQDKTGHWRIELSASINEKQRMEAWLANRNKA